MSAGRPTFYRTQLAKNSPTVVGTKGTELPVNLRVYGIFPVPSASMELAQEIDHVPYGCAVLYIRLCLLQLHKQST